MLVHEPRRDTASGGKVSERRRGAYHGAGSSGGLGGEEVLLRRAGGGVSVPHDAWRPQAAGEADLLPGRMPLGDGDRRGPVRKRAGKAEEHERNCI